MIAALNTSIVVLLLSISLCVFSQPSNAIRAADDADSVFIRTFVRNNDIRAFYGGQGNRMVIGSLRDGSPDLTKSIYNNTNDFIGIGGTYKWLDGDLSLSLPGTTYLHEERSNLDQFKISGAYTRRKISYRGYITDSKGVVVSGNNDEYESTPTLHEFRMGLQATYIFNERKYSYRAALYQSELQLKTAGSFLLRTEAFFRDLGGNGQHMIPESHDIESRFGEQTGLTYIKAPGILFMPGYGANFVFRNPRLFISPVLLAGTGIAFNNYKSDKGKGSHTNMEYNLWFLVNAGYNGDLIYSRLQFNYSASYSPINPAYLSTANLMMSWLVGFRFKNFK